MATSSPTYSSIFVAIFVFISISNPSTQTAANSTTDASKDYGNIEHKTPRFVLQPASVRDIIHLVKLSFTVTNESIAARGHGHSVRGQPLTDGVVVNMTALSNKTEIVIGGDDKNGYYVNVSGGDMWIDVLKKTLVYGFAPVSWTDYLRLTVGGTLSNAGISGQAFMHGPQISNVLELDVVTGKGEFLTCSPRKKSKLFFAALGGLGQFGIITRARIVVAKAPKMTKWVQLIYNNFSSFTRDQEHLISTNVSSYVQGYLIINTTAITNFWRSSNFQISNSAESQIDTLLKNQSILYSIELAKYYNDVIDEEFETLLGNMSFVQGLNFSLDVSFLNFINRGGDLDTPKMGSNLYHPWLNLFIPKSDIANFNELVLVNKLPSLHLTPGIYLIYPMNRNKWNHRMSAVIPEENQFYFIGLLHSSPNNYTMFDDFNNDILCICKNAGIELKLYLHGYKTQEEWKNHFGEKWGAFSYKKGLFDPNHILSQGQGIFN